MKVFKENMRTIVKKCGEEMELINKQYEEYTSPQANQIYAEVLINNKIQERNNKCAVIIQKYTKEINKYLEAERKALEPNMDIISSSDYQTRLSNTLSLLSLSKGKIDINSLEYIAEAGDMNTLNIISNAYSDNFELVNYARENDTNNLMEKVEVLAEYTKQGMDINNNTLTAQMAREILNKED